jgi:hypothetical protein
MTNTGVRSVSESYRQLANPATLLSDQQVRMIASYREESDRQRRSRQERRRILEQKQRLRVHVGVTKDFVIMPDGVQDTVEPSHEGLENIRVRQSALASIHINTNDENSSREPRQTIQDVGQTIDTMDSLMLSIHAHNDRPIDRNTLHTTYLAGVSTISPVVDILTNAVAVDIPSVVVTPVDMSCTTLSETTLVLGVVDENACTDIRHQDQPMNTRERVRGVLPTCVIDGVAPCVIRNNM